MNWVSMFNVKLDVLGLRTVSVVHECCNILKETRDIHLKPQEIDLDDKFIYQNLFDLKNRHGLFQIEADANYEVCRKVKPKNLEELSAVLALGRPGAMQFIDQFANYSNNGVYEAIHPFFDDILKDTGGVALYQEQLMKMANKIGFTLDEAEILRRIVGKKKVKEVRKWKKKIREKVKENKISSEWIGSKGDVDVGDVLWKVLEDSANYSFNKSHSISYASLAAITTFLKFKYPKEFFLALLKMTRFEPDPIAEIAKVSREFPKFGMKLLSPNLLKSKMDFSIEGDNIRFGLTSIKGISDKSIKKLESFRDKYSNKFQVFHGAGGAGIGVGILSALIQAGALEDEFNHSRSHIVAEAQLWNLLTPREKTFALEHAEEKKCDLIKIITFLNKDRLDHKGSPIIKDSRLDTIRRNFKPYKEIYDKNRRNEDFANWYYENTLLGHPHKKPLRKVSEEYSYLESIEEAIEKRDGSRVNFIGTIVDTSSFISRKGTPSLRMQIQDETGACTAMMFGATPRKPHDTIAHCKEDNGGTLPVKKSIVIVKGTKKDGDTIFADVAVVQDQKIFMKLSEIKGLTS